MATPFSGTVCHQYAGTSYDQPARQIWSIHAHPLRIQRKNVGIWWFGR